MLQAAAAASSLPPSDSSPLSCKGAVGGGGGGRRKPLQILTGIFSRKGNNTREMPDSSSEERDNFFLPDDGDVDMWDSGGEIMDDGGIIPEPREALHSPYHARTIDQDMQNLRLSRQDNPFLQVLASRECLNESDDGSEYEEKNLMSKENLSSHSRPGEPLSLEEVHARLVRSPPPVMWTRGGHNSEPSFTHLTTTTSSSLGADFVFQFPPAGAEGAAEVLAPPPDQVRHSLVAARAAAGGVGVAFWAHFATRRALWTFSRPSLTSPHNRDDVPPVSRRGVVRLSLIIHI
ncbi:uncharacterized protein LOC110857029 isoform X2 [Folsomia candida]|nr:uncharacterized protein LOC110857029 isoform X2 [Folsomia candida]